MARKEYTRLHERYLLEWLWRTYPPGSWTINKRLGLPHPELTARFVDPTVSKVLVVTLHRCDAVVVLPEEVHLVECLIRNEFWKIERLKIYADQFEITEEYKKHWHKPKILILLTPLRNPFYELHSAEIGIKWVLYRPFWLETYLGGLRVGQREGYLGVAT